MRLAVGMLYVLICASASLSTAGEQKGTTKRGETRYTVLCRQVNADGSVVLFPKLHLASAEKGVFSNVSPAPFVTGVTSLSDPSHPDASAQQPQIATIDEGLKADVVLFPYAPGGGVSINVSAELTNITDRDTKTISSNTTIQVPQVDVTKRRVFDFVKFGETLTIPLGEKKTKESTPRLEITIGFADKQPHWNLNAEEKVSTPEEARKNEALEKLLDSGAATIVRQNATRWKILRGHEFACDIPMEFRVACLAADYYSYLPHRTGMIDVCSLLNHVISDDSTVRLFETAIFGRLPTYSVQLTDSPTIEKNVELLGQIPYLWDVTIRANLTNEQLRRAIKKLKVINQLDASEPLSMQCILDEENAANGAPPERKSISSNEKNSMGDVTPRSVARDENKKKRRSEDGGTWTIMNGYSCGSFPEEQPAIKDQYPVNFGVTPIIEVELSSWFQTEVFFSERKQRLEVSDRTVTSCDAEGNVVIEQNKTNPEGVFPLHPQQQFAADNLSVPYIGNNYLASLQDTVSGRMAKSEIALTDIALKAEAVKRLKPPTKEEEHVFVFYLGCGER